MSCTRDLTPTPKQVTGNRRTVEALFRRLTTPRGMLGSDKSYGTCVEDIVGETFTERDVSSLKQDIAAECMKQRDVRRVLVDATWNASTRTLTIKVQAFGPFGIVAFGATLAAGTGTGLLLDA